MFLIRKAQLDRYDVHLKTIDGVNQQTILGSILTIVAFFVIALLIHSEFLSFSSTHIVTRMKTDSYNFENNQESIKIIFDFEFPNLPCSMLSYNQEITRGTVHVYEHGQNISKMPLKIENSTESNLQSCRIYGDTITDKVAGTIKLSIDHAQVPDDFLVVPFEAPDLTHKVNTLAYLSANSKIAMESEIPGLNHNPLSGQVAVGVGVGIYQYAIQIVPTQYTTLTSDVLTAHQYSVTERQVQLETALRGVVISSQAYKDFIGILITYDFYPVILAMEETKDDIFEFLSNLCGIIGGVLTVLMLLEKCLHGSSKALIGKND